jgi:hypothetical protein
MATLVQRWCGKRVQLGCPLHCDVGSHSPQRIGSLNVNVEPEPSWLLTQILPPWSSTNLRQRVSPSPVPSAFFSAVPGPRYRGDA